MLWAVPVFLDHPRLADSLAVARQHDGTTVSPVAWDRFGVFSVGVVILVAGAGSGQACRV